MQATNDRELVQRALRGDADAFATLAEQYAESVFALSYGRLLHHADAEDVTQETFLRAYEKLGQLREPDRFEGWVHRIATMLAYDRLRRRAREMPMDTRQLLRDAAPESDDYDAFEREADAERLMAPALKTLPDHLRVAFVMLHVTGASYATLARRLHISPTAAERRVQRARDRLRQYFRRRGDARMTESLAIASPVGDEFLAGVHDAWRRGSPPSPYAVETAGSPRMAGMLAAGLATTMVFLAGVYGAQMMHLRWGDLKRDGSVRYIEVASRSASPLPTSAPTAPGRVRELIRPGEELQGWMPQERDKDTSLPQASTGPGSRVTAVFANDFGAYKRVPPAYGEVTLDVRVKVRATPYQSEIGLLFGDSPVGTPIVSKQPTNLWSYYTQNEPEGYRPFRPTAERWSSFQIIFRTWTGRYDLVMDGAVVARDAPYSAWEPGRPVTGVYLHSGRGDVGEPMYFADMTLSAREPTPAELRDHAQPPPAVATAPAAFDRMALVVGQLNGAELSVANPTLVVSPRARIRGRLEVAVTNEHDAPGDFHVIETPTWGDHASSYEAVAAHVPPGEHSIAVPIDRSAPRTPGTYYVIVAGAAETSAAYVASGTNWPVGEPRWNDGTDISGWPQRLLDSVMATGTVRAPWLGHDGHARPAEVGAVAVRIVVRD